MNEYVILLDGGGSVDIFADTCEWDSDELCFTNEYMEDGIKTQTIIAMFKMEHVVGYFRKTLAKLEEATL